MWSLMHDFGIWRKHKYRKNTQVLLEASREVGLEVNREKTKHIVMSLHKNSWKNPNLLIANKFFENVAKFKYSGTTETNQSFIHEEIKSRIIPGMLATILFRVSCLPFSPLKT
jgi:hypothetical protein